MKKQTSILLSTLAVIGLFMSVLFNNCGQVEYLGPDKLADLTGLDKNADRYVFEMIINQGDAYTNKADVVVTYTAPQATSMLVSTDPTCPGDNWIEPQENMNFTIPNNSLNSEFTLYTKFVDLDGQETACISDAIIHDNVSPVPTIAGPVKPVGNGAIPFTISGTDNLSGIKFYECSIDGGNTFVSCPEGNYSLPSANEGPNTLIVRAIDNAGNPGTSPPFVFTVDTTAPEVKITSMPPKETSMTSANLEFVGTDASKVTYKCTLNNNPVSPCTSPQPLTNLTPGDYTFTVTVTDEVGLTDSDSYSWKVVPNVPSVEIVKGPDNPTNQTSATFTFKGEAGGQPLTEFKCKLDQGNYKKCDPGVTYNNLTPNEEHTFYVVAVSNGVESEPAIYKWMIDAKGPAITLTQKPPKVTNNPNSTFVVTPQDPGDVSKFVCKIDGQIVPCPDGVIKDYPTTDGPHKAEIVAYDKSGNPSEPLIYEWLIDRINPTVLITKGPDKSTQSPDAKFELKAADRGGSGLKTLMCSLDGGAYVECDSFTEHVLSQLSPGTHVFTVYAIDNAGNHSLSPQPIYIWDVDNKGPEIVIVQAPSSHEYGQVKDIIEFKIKDKDLVKVQCGFAGNLQDCEAHTLNEYMALNPGQYNYQIVATDKLGNTTTFEIIWTVSTSFEMITQMIDVNDSNNEIDVLFVVDNSGSMGYEQRSMASRIGNFMEKVKDLDYRIAVTSTDAYKEDGRILSFSNGADYLSTNMSLDDNQALLAKRLQLGFLGSGREQGIHNTYRAIERALASPQSANGQFFRKDSAIAVVLISDEDESRFEKRNKPENLVQFIKDSYGENKRFEFHSIITKTTPELDVACKKGNGYSYGYTYTKMSQMTGGSIGSVCASDYASQLETIGDSIRNQVVNSISLKCMPVDSDQDGKPELVITLDNGQEVKNYTLSGLKVTFDSPLPMGQHTAEYQCIKKPMVQVSNN